MSNASPAPERLGFMDRLRRPFHDALTRQENELDARSPVDSCVGDCSNGLQNLDCAGLAREKEQTQLAQERAQLSEAVYDPPDQRNLPPGYRHVTRDELAEMGLYDPDTRENLLRPGHARNFHADVFKHDASGRTEIVFRGTDAFNDLSSSTQQWRGIDTAQYVAARRIGDAIAGTPGLKTHFSGHSLGGGLAVTGANAAGGSATTFNSSSVHPGNLRNAPSVQAWNVRGDVLSLAQDSGRGLPAATGRRVLLDPVPHRTTGSIASRFTQIRTRNLRLHGIAEVRASLDARVAEIARLQKKKGCLG